MKTYRTPDPIRRGEPGTYLFGHRFPTGEVAFLVARRIPDGFVCEPHGKWPFACELAVILREYPLWRFHISMIMEEMPVSEEAE